MNGLEKDGLSASGTIAGAPCWVTLLSRELSTAQAFYTDVLGWSYRPTRLGDHFRAAFAGGSPVAGIGGLASSLQVPVSWTPYFAVADVDEAAARIRERGATVAVGPIAFHTGRAALAADPGGASFGIWEGAVRSDWTVGRDSAPAWLELRTRDTADAARFYRQVLGWPEGGESGTRGLAYDDATATLRQDGHTVARIRDGAVPASADPQLRPRWHVHFRVPEVAVSVEAALSRGGALVSPASSADGTREATLRDPDGALFTVTAA